MDSSVRCCSPPRANLISRPMPSPTSPGTRDTRSFYEEHAQREWSFYNLQTLFGAALVSEETVISNDPVHDPRKGGSPEGHPALDTFLAAPIKTGGKLVAMVGMANRPGGYDRELTESAAASGDHRPTGEGPVNRQRAQAG